MPTPIITVVTGFGYYKDKNGRVVCKAMLPPGEYPLGDDYEYVEVADHTALDQLEFDVDPIDLQKQQTEILINQKTRELAIAQLKDEGKLPVDFVDVASKP